MNERYIIGINEGDYGSTGSIAINVLEASKSIGLTPAFATYESYNKCAFEIKLISNKIDEFANRLFCRIDGSDGFHNILVTRIFLEKIETLNIGIIHLHNIHGRYINLPLIFEFARRKNIKIVWTLHDCWAFTGKCVHFELSNCYKWRECCGHCPIKAEYPAAYLFDRSRQNLKKKIALYKKYGDLITIVCPSHWLYSQFIQSKANFLNCITIHNGIKQSSEAAGEKLKIPNSNKKNIFLAVAAGFDKRKGFNYINKLANELDPAKFLFVVVGLPKGEKNISKRIYNVGYINDEALLKRYYAAADALINPTLEDNFPTVNLEALSSGTPVITFNTGGSPESINKRCGIVVKKGSYEELKKAVATFDKKMFPTYECLQQAENFSAKKMCDSYLQLFEKLMR